MNNKKTIQISISVIGILLIAAHLIWPELKVDSITVVIFAIIIIPWLAPVFKTLEFPGGMKLEYNLEKVTQKLEDSGLINSKNNVGSSSTHHKYSFMNVVDIDSELALTGLRMEIESRLQQLSEYAPIQVKNKSVGALTKSLEANDLLTRKETSAINDLLPILNRAAHGEKIERNLHNWVMEIGPQLLDTLESKIGKQKLPTLIKTYENRDGAIGVEIGHELSKKLIQSTEPFFSEMKKNQVVFDDWLSDIQNSTFTIFEGEDEIDELLNHAKYVKLKEIMIDSIEKYLTKRKDKLAEKTLDKTKEIEIKSIW